MYGNGQKKITDFFSGKTMTPDCMIGAAKEIQRRRMLIFMNELIEKYGVNINPNEKRIYYIKEIDDLLNMFWEDHDRIVLSVLTAKNREEILKIGIRLDILFFGYRECILNKIS